MKKLLEIFSPGKHTAMSGEVIEFTEAQLRACAAAYNPELHEAPIVVGHPKTEDPAYGWIKSLSYNEKLLGQPDQVDPAFAEMVNAGRFKKPSGSFYKPDSPNNPVPGVYYLRHVGYLGAVPPAVKGLKSASFAAGEKGIVEFGDWVDTQSAHMFRRLRDWLISKFGMDEAEKVLPDYAVQTLEDAARAPAPSDAMPTGDMMSTTYSETQLKQEQAMDLKAKESELTVREQGVKKKEESFAERETRLQAAEKKALRAELVSFTEALVTEGKILPAKKAELVEFMASLTPETTLEFGEGDKKTTKPAVVWFREYLAAQPKLVEFAEIAKGKGVLKENEDPTVIANRAVEFQEAEAKAGRTINVAQAVAHVTAGK